MADWMREVVDSTLGPAKATRQIRTEHRTPTGGTTYTWNDGSWSYCNVAPMASDELELAGRMEVKGTVSCRVSAMLDVDTHDRIKISDTEVDELDGDWEVTAVMTSSTVVDRLLYLSRIGGESAG
jgi:head-tail adaptor